MSRSLKIREKFQHLYLSLCMIAQLYTYCSDNGEEDLHRPWGFWANKGCQKKSWIMGSISLVMSKKDLKLPMYRCFRKYWSLFFLRYFFITREIGPLNPNFFGPQITLACGSCDFRGPKKVWIHGLNLPWNKKSTAKKNNVPHFLKQWYINSYYVHEWEFQGPPIRNMGGSPPSGTLWI